MRTIAAILISVAVHAAIAAGIAAYFAFSDPPCDVFAELDLGSVELSISNEDAETAPAAQDVITPPTEEDTPSPPKEDLPPRTDVDKTLPPEMEAMKLSEPEDIREKMDTPPEPPQEVHPAPVQARIDAPPKPMRTIRPKYPDESRKKGEEGKIALEITVAADGAVKSAKIVSSCGYGALEAAAVKAVTEARFTPAKASGRNVESVARLTLDFKLK